ncbi:hypothetical protein [Psychroflexus tropicus]|uniref:hypothetical protein n=1 Tax=Psychroflexus tropicus TaxID=197345 RepID=UPI0003637F9F|nr:hypothetical protein [Psychroflexus tropicus]
MKQNIFYILTLILIIGCSTKTEKNQTEIETETVVENSIERLDSISAQELEKLIKVPVRNKFDEMYNGHYSFTTDEQGQKVLNGDFEFIHFDSSAFYDPLTKEYDTTWISISKIEYQGTFANGVKNGTFKEKLLFDDGIDLYSKWTVSLDFKDDKCSKGTFTGILGHIMPESTYEFEKLDTCTFQSVVDKASERWKEEYEKRKN